MTPKLTVATSFPVFPPQGGGQARIHGLYTEVARRGIEVDVVALVAAGARGGAREVAPGVREIRVPKTVAHDARETALTADAGVPVTDIALTLLHELTPDYGAALAASARDAAAVVASHPFAQPALPAGVPLIYEAHNVEYDLKAAMLPENPAGDELRAAVRAVEAECCERADHVMTCSTQDTARLGELYGLDPERAVVVANGVDADSVDYVEPAARRGLRDALGLGPQALFIGSWHEPNLVAVRDIMGAAERLPDIRFVIVGSAGNAFANETPPPNVDLCGVVAAGFIRSVLRVADVALNPMRFGSGTNLKMLDYALAGVPLASSAVGVRGLDLEPGRHYRPLEADELAGGLPAALAEPADVRATREHVLARFTWPVIVDGWLAHPHMAALLEEVPALR